MQTLLLIVNGLLMAMVLMALAKGSRVAYLTGLAQGKARGFAEGLQKGIAAAQQGTLQAVPGLKGVSITSKHLAS
jgi:flagellar biosynthesis/type III secretory pathway protein FliH